MATAALPAIVNPATDRKRGTAAAWPVPPLAVAVYVQTPDGHDRRSLFLSLAAGHRALARAEARGVPARLRVCALVPMDGAS